MLQRLLHGGYKHRAELCSLVRACRGRGVAAHREQGSIVFAITGYRAEFGLHTTLPRKGSAYSSRANDKRGVSRLLVFEQVFFYSGV